MTTAVQSTPRVHELVRLALEAFRNDSSYAAEMVSNARALERKKRR